jgi:hypothetical protein
VERSTQHCVGTDTPLTARRRLAVGAFQLRHCAASFGRVDSSLNRICQSSESNDLKVIVEGVV